MAVKPADDSEPSAWLNLGAVEQAREWEEFRPGTFEQMFALVVHEAEYRRNRAEEEARHERRLDYISIGLQALAIVFALVTVILLVVVARYYADHGDANQGVKVFGFGAGSIVAAFLGISASPMIKRIGNRSARGKRDS
jgi:predicted nicotinamide N-methyase